MAAWSDIPRKEKRPEEEILQEHNMVGVRGRVEGIISHPLSISNLPQLRFYAIRQYISYSLFEASIQPKDIAYIKKIDPLMTIIIPSSWPCLLEQQIKSHLLSVRWDSCLAVKVVTSVPIYSMPPSSTRHHFFAIVFGDVSLKMQRN